MPDEAETTSLLEESLESMSANTGKCRICWRTSYVSDLISPCVCSGSQKYTHFECLKRWIVERDSDRKDVCDVCQQEYQHIIITQTHKSFVQWLKEGEDVSSKIFSTLLLMAFFFYLINMGCIQFVISDGQISSILRYIQLSLIIMFSVIFFSTFIVAIYVFVTEFREWQSAHMNTLVDRVDHPYATDSDSDRHSIASSTTTYQSGSSAAISANGSQTSGHNNRNVMVNESALQYGTI